MKRIVIVVLAALSIGVVSASETVSPDQTERAARAELANAERDHGATSRETADALAALIDAQRDDFSIETHATEVEALARREVELRSKLDGENSQAYAKALGHLGYAQAAEFSNDEASLQFDRAYSIIETLGDRADSSTRAEADFNRAFIRRMQRRDFDHAAKMIESGLAIAPDLPPLRRAQAMLWLAGIEWYLHHADRFLAVLDDAEQALARAQVSRHPYQADLLRWRALAELDAGHFPAAIALSNRALAIASSAVPYSVSMHTMALDSSGQLEVRLGAPEKAQQYSEQALALQTAHPTSGGYLLGMMQYEMCVNLGTAEDPAAAAPHCRAAVTALESLRPPPPMEFSGALNNLASNLSNMGFDREAIPVFKRSLEYSGKTAIQSSRGFIAEIALSSVELHLGQYADAETLLRRHLIRIDSNDDFALRNSRSTHVGLAAALWGQNRLAEAFENAAMAAHSAALVRHVSASDLDERRAMSALDHLDDGLDWMVAIAAASQDVGQIEQTWDAVLEARGTVSTMVARRLSIAHASTDPRLAEDWHRWQETNERLAQARVALARTPSEITHDALIAAERDFDAAELTLAANTGDTGERLRIGRSDWRAVHAALPEHAVLVRFIESDAAPRDFQRTTPEPIPRLYALIGSRDSVPRMVALGDARPIAAAAAAWYRLAAVDDSDPQALSDAAMKLRRLAWDPLGKIDAKRVLLIPSPSLERVNFAALQTDSGRYLVESGPQFHLLEHERDLLREPVKAKSTRMLLAGAPDFAGGRSSSSESRGNCAGLRASTFTPLPGARAELAALDRLGSDAAMKTTLLEGKDATEPAVRAAVATANIIHFATHGIFLGEHCALPGPTNTRGIALVSGPGDDTGAEPGALSALAFSGANSKGQDSADDGLLTSDEITALDLGATDWAVLSACETALGEVTAQEGVLGLRRAFHLAGARSVIMSLWRVDDLATTQFMQALYRARLERHADTIDSMYAAMRETLDARRRADESTSPYYWAGFVAAGDWR